MPIITIHDLPSLTEALDENSEFIVNNSSTGVVQANKVTLTQILQGTNAKIANLDGDIVELQTEVENAQLLTGISGYDASKTQVLKNINGTFEWVDEEN